MKDRSVPRPVIDQRVDATPVPPDGVERRAQRLSPRPPMAGVAIVVDSWPLMRAGIRQMLQEAAFRVAADDVSGVAAGESVQQRLDLAVLGVTREPLVEMVQHLRMLPGPDKASSPRILVLLDRVELTELKQLLAAGVAGVLQRTTGMDELGKACGKVMAGQRVLAGGPLSVLASEGLEISTAPPAQTEDADAALLTPKESEVLGHLANHCSNAQIAEQMHLTAATVKTHLSNIYAKLGVGGRREAVVEAVQQGLLS